MLHMWLNGWTNKPNQTKPGDAELCFASCIIISMQLFIWSCKYTIYLSGSMMTQILKAHSVYWVCDTVLPKTSSLNIIGLNSNSCKVVSYLCYATPAATLLVTGIAIISISISITH